MSFLQTTFLENTLQSWAIALGVTLLAYLVLRVTARVLLSRLARLAPSTETDWDDIISTSLQKTRGWTLLIFAIFLGAIPLSLPEGVLGALASVAAIALFLQAGFWLSTG
ncbi:MAG: hypothetical protein R6T96_13990, partial [Longimicrobiales bacterium]